MARLLTDLNKLKHNLITLKDKCDQHKINITAVSKVVLANKDIINVFYDCGITSIGDSRIDNLKKIHSNVEKILLRVPSYDEISDVISYCDTSLNSSMKTLDKLNQEAIKQSKFHNIILMIDLGDLREGVYFKDRELIVETVSFILNSSNLILKGIGTNLTCFGGVIPTIDNMHELLSIKNMIFQKFNYEIEVVSGGNSSSINLLLENNIPNGINNLRLGESIFLGKETAYGNLIEGLYDDVFVLETNIIELFNKPSVPYGISTINAFGESVQYKDKGLMKRGILDVGRQDVDYHDLINLNQNIELLGSSSDHLIVDLTNFDYNIGDKIYFKLSYGGLLRLSTSPYIKIISF